MDPSPRRLRILRLLQEAESLKVGELARRLDVSKETIRRDLTALSACGAILRSHGAASLPPASGEALFERRMRENRLAKEALARLAAAAVRDGESVMLDAGAVASLVARALLERRGLSVVANASDVARALGGRNGDKVYMACGEWRGDSGAVFGGAAIEFVRRFSVDHAIVMAGGVHAERGILDSDLEEAEFRRAVLSCGARRTVAAEDSAFGRLALAQVCGFEMVDELIVNRAPPEDLAEALRLGDVRLRAPQA